MQNSKQIYCDKNQSEIIFAQRLKFLSIDQGET